MFLQEMCCGVVQISAKIKIKKIGEACNLIKIIELNDNQQIIGTKYFEKIRDLLLFN